MFSIILVLTICTIGSKVQGSGGVIVRPCNDQVSINIKPKPSEQYILRVNKTLTKDDKVILTFDSEAFVKLLDPSSALISAVDEDTFSVIFTKKTSGLGVMVKGSDTLPYLTDIEINGLDFCEHNLMETGYLEDIIKNYESSESNNLDQSCGRRKVDHTPLIIRGQPTKPGDWPWHVALYRLDGASLNYICGGTLLSKTLILTAAHCVTIRGVPVSTEVLNVVLGKYNLFGGDISAQESKVHRIIVHEKFQFKLLENDISLLKLKSEAVFNEFVQPVCLWDVSLYEKLPAGQIFGNVAGWGFDQTDTPSKELQQANIPLVSELTCIKNNPIFYSKMLNGQRFCAGYTNGTSACNGDSGGGFVVYIPDSTDKTSNVKLDDISDETLNELPDNASGTWYLRGVLSNSLVRKDAPICDPTGYVVFTDVVQYRKWVTDMLFDELPDDSDEDVD